MNTEDFVTYEQAKILKELKFDCKCNHYYGLDGFLHEETKSYLTNYIYDNDNLYLISAPTLAQVLKWLRKKNIEVMSYYDYTTKTWIYEICEIGDPHSCGYHSDDFGSNKSTYEEAISAGIDTALEIYFWKELN